MGLGYAIGCLLSIIFWKVNRFKVFDFIERILFKYIKNYKLREYIYIAIAIIILFIPLKGELINCFTIFFVIDVSRMEKKKENIVEKVHFYETISLVSKSIVNGYIGPLIYILLFGNSFALAYAIINNLSNIDAFRMIGKIEHILTLIPSILVGLFLYIIYIFRNKQFFITFKGDYLKNLIVNPLVNVDILAAYIENVNYYYYYYNGRNYCIRSYGHYKNKITSECIKDYISIAYLICIVCIILFFYLV